MALLVVLLQQVQQVGLDPLRRAGIDAQLEGDPVSRLEADTPDVQAELVGIGLEDLVGAGPVLAVDFVGQGRGDAVLLEEDDQVADIGVLGPGLPDVLELGRADARHFGHALRLFVQDVERPVAELGHDAGSQGRPDALDQPAGEIFLDALESRRQDRLEGLHLELRAEFGAGLPDARKLQPLAGGEGRKRAHDGDLLSVVDGKFQHGIAVVGIEEQYRFDRAFQCFHCGYFSMNRRRPRRRTWPAVEASPPSVLSMDRDISADPEQRRPERLVVQPSPGAARRRPEHQCGLHGRIFPRPHRRHVHPVWRSRDPGRRSRLLGLPLHLRPPGKDVFRLPPVPGPEHFAPRPGRADRHAGEHGLFRGLLRPRFPGRVECPVDGPFPSGRDRTRGPFPLPSSAAAAGDDRRVLRPAGGRPGLCPLAKDRFSGAAPAAAHGHPNGPDRGQAGDDDPPRRADPRFRPAPGGRGEAAEFQHPDRAGKLGTAGELHAQRPFRPPPYR